MNAVQDTVSSMAAEWDSLLAAAKRLAANAEEPAAGPRYASEFGLALVGLAAAAEIAPEERRQLYIRAEVWLTHPRRPARDLLRRLVRELGAMRAFTSISVGTRSHLGSLQAALEA